MFLMNKSPNYYIQRNFFYSHIKNSSLLSLSWLFMFKQHHLFVFHQTWPPTLLGGSLSWRGCVSWQGSYTDVKQLFQDLDLVPCLEFFPFFTYILRICTTCQQIIIIIAHCGCARIQILLCRAVHELFFYNLGDAEHASKDVSYRGWSAISTISSSGFQRVPTIYFWVSFFLLTCVFILSS